MTPRLNEELVRELERAGDRPLHIENPLTKRIYVLADAERYEVVPRSAESASAGWSAQKNDRRCALIRKKFSLGIDAAEACELNDLQDQLSAYRKRTVPLPYDVVDALREAADSAAAPVPLSRALAWDGVMSSTSRSL